MGGGGGGIAFKDRLNNFYLEIVDTAYAALNYILNFMMFIIHGSSNVKNFGG